MIRRFGPLRFPRHQNNKQKKKKKKKNRESQRRTPMRWLGVLLATLAVVLLLTIVHQKLFVLAFNNTSSTPDQIADAFFMVKSKKEKDIVVGDGPSDRPRSSSHYDVFPTDFDHDDDKNNNNNNNKEWLTNLLRAAYDDYDQQLQQHEGKASCQGQTEQLERHPNCHCRALRPKSRGCCVRQFFHNHKHGSWLAESVLGQALWLNEQDDDGPEPLVDQSSSTSRIVEINQQHQYMTGDYRTVVMVRNWYDAVISGYLYHKDGRECWKTASGETIKDEPTMTMDPFMQHGWIDHVPDTISSPNNKNNNRSLCEYLVQEPMDVGLRTYLHVAMNRWHLPLLRVYQARHDDCNRTMYLCYMDLLQLLVALDRKQKANNDTIERLLDHWFPSLVDGTSNKKRPSNAAILSSIGSDNNKTSPSLGAAAGHGTTKNAAMRLKILKKIQQLDKVDWNYTIARSNALFGCKGDLE